MNLDWSAKWPYREREEGMKAWGGEDRRALLKGKPGYLYLPGTKGTDPAETMDLAAMGLVSVGHFGGALQ